MTKQTKKPVHPGVFLHDILLSGDPFKFSGIDDMAKYLKQEIEVSCYYFGVSSFKQFLLGELSLNNVLAYKLAIYVKGTDVRFWMDLQKEYDEWEALNKKESDDDNKTKDSSYSITITEDNIYKVAQEVIKIAESGYQWGWVNWAKVGSNIIFSEVSGSKYHVKNGGY